ncbi:rRNA maturation RNase YbeY [Lignipirellula cremea]|uniref:Endoribonuclease YbeY n=1 Tax=Lignipirellula cremea TaxID=2528010 RepID=A0A518E253_9BACT|nr:rRNA maturation RNase YbeY [Lignipirellula cremea]QDU98143.1 Endoribonuclease YbeY [Lignipirellula cremea]
MNASSSPPLELDCTNRQTRLPVEERPLLEGLRLVLHEAGVRTGAVSLAIVDDPAMHVLNREHLEHDYPTDVLSFLFDRQGEHLEGEIIVSVDTAQSSAADLQIPWAHELLLYVVHGALHLVGHDDHSPAERQAMRAAESHYLAALGVCLPSLPEPQE